MLYDQPFGWENGDPCIVCINQRHREYVQQAFKLRAHYILPLSNIGGRRYNKVIVFRGFMIRGSSEEMRFNRWVDESLRTSLSVNHLNEIYFV